MGNPDPHAYGFAKWNGSEWKLFRLEATASNGNVSNVRPKGILVFNQNDIWFSGGSVWHWNGQNLIFSLERFNFFNGGPESIDKLWGTSDDNIYGVGTYGTIAHYTNGQWTKIQSGTDLNINDIWGDYNEKTDEWEILAVGGNILQGWESERVILKINKDQVQQLNANGTIWPLRTIWFKTSKKYYVAGSGVYEKHYINQNRWENDVYDITTYSINNMRGIFINEVAAVGGAGELIYFNGFCWKSYFSQTHINGNYRSITIKDNLIIAVGQDAPNAAITVGYRTN